MEKHLALAVRDLNPQSESAITVFEKNDAVYKETQAIAEPCVRKVDNTMYERAMLCNLCQHVQHTVEDEKK